MLKRIVPLFMIFLVAATAAQAQSGPGRGRGGGGRPSSGGSSSPTASATPAPKPPKPTNQISIVGVVKVIDLDAKRITIAYEPVDGLNWPAGTMPFSVYDANLLKTVSVGQKVRFKLDSQQITELTPY
jgi:Cu/Ag efflux protein CusF